MSSKTRHRRFAALLDVLRPRSWSSAKRRLAWVESKSCKCHVAASPGTSLGASGGGPSTPSTTLTAAHPSLAASSATLDDGPEKTSTHAAHSDKVRSIARTGHQSAPGTLALFRSLSPRGPPRVPSAVISALRPRNAAGDARATRLPATQDCCNCTVCSTARMLGGADCAGRRHRHGDTRTCEAHWMHRCVQPKWLRHLQGILI